MVVWNPSWSQDSRVIAFLLLRVENPPFHFTPWHHMLALKSLKQLLALILLYCSTERAFSCLLCGMHLQILQPCSTLVLWSFNEFIMSHFGQNGLPNEVSKWRQPGLKNQQPILEHIFKFFNRKHKPWTLIGKSTTSEVEHIYIFTMYLRWERLWQ